jgi:hypothetical protein
MRDFVEDTMTECELVEAGVYVTNKSDGLLLRVEVAGHTSLIYIDRFSFHLDQCVQDFFLYPRLLMQILQLPLLRHLRSQRLVWAILIFDMHT